MAIARAFLRDAPVLILDEATAHLDEGNESQIHRSVRAWQKKESVNGFPRTVLVITHRLSCVRDASRIIVLEHGRVAGVGCHEELMAKSRVYQDLFSAQSQRDLFGKETRAS